MPLQQTPPPRLCEGSTAGEARGTPTEGGVGWEDGQGQYMNVLKSEGGEGVCATFMQTKMMGGQQGYQREEYTHALL